MSKGIEEEKERMISCFKENIKGCETSKEDDGKQIIKDITKRKTVEIVVTNQVEWYKQQLTLPHKRK